MVKHCFLPLGVKRYIWFSRATIFSFLKDSTPILIVLPRICVDQALQRRNSYLLARRALYFDLNFGSFSLTFTYVKDRASKEWERALLALSKLIDRVRSLYLNIGDKGAYPGLISVRSAYVHLQGDAEVLARLR